MPERPLNAVSNLLGVLWVFAQPLAMQVPKIVSAGPNTDQPGSPLLVRQDSQSVGLSMPFGAHIAPYRLSSVAAQARQDVEQ